MILGVNGNETVNQINTGKLALPGGDGIQDLKQATGWRSAQFDFLLEEAAQQKPNPESSPFLQRQRQRKEEAQGTANSFINDLSGGDIVTDI